MRRTGGRVGVLVYRWARRVIVPVLLLMLRRRTMTMRVMFGVIVFVIVFAVVVMRVVRHHVVGARGETRGAAGVASIGWRRMRMCGVCM